MLRLINDLLDLDKIESGKVVFQLQAVAIDGLVDQVVDSSQAYARERGVRLAVTKNAPDAKVNADADKLVQVITNLLANAVKFSPQGGVVSFSITRHDGMIRVGVTDQGPGIPDDFKPHIFEKFAQSNLAKKEGTGLGLSISKAIVERLGGRIGFNSEPNVDTTFYFDLPEFNDPSFAGKAS